MKKILILGAGFLQTFVIKKSMELGYYTYAVDGCVTAPGFEFADEYSVIDIIDSEACLTYAMSKHVDGVLTAATDYGVLTASYIANHMNIPGIKYKTAQTIKNKYLTQRTLYEAHVDDIKQVLELKNNEDIKNAKNIVKLPVMVKPCDGSGSRGATKVENIEDFAEACEQAMMNSLTHRAVVETFMTGEEYGVESFVYNGKTSVLAVMKKWMTSAPYYAELGHAIPSGLDNSTEEHIKKCAIKAIEALGIDFGAVNMDLLLTDDKEVHVIDIGARMGGNLIGSNIIPAGTGIDYMGAIIKSAVGDPVCLMPSRHPHCVVTKLLALSPGEVKGLPDFHKIERKYNVSIYHHLNIGEIIPEYHTNLDGCGYVVSVAEDYGIALEHAEKALAEINDKIERF